MKRIKGFEKYYIDRMGNVYSKTKRIIKVHKNRQRRAIVFLRDKNGNPKVKSLSRLVANAFIANPHSYPCVLHNDNNPLNNTFTNLRWGTQRQNIKQMDQQGRRKNNPCIRASKYTIEICINILNLRLKGQSINTIGKELGIKNLTRIDQIIKAKTNDSRKALEMINM